MVRTCKRIPEDGCPEQGASTHHNIIVIKIDLTTTSDTKTYESYNDSGNSNNSLVGNLGGLCRPISLSHSAAEALRSQVPFEAGALQVRTIWEFPGIGEPNIVPYRILITRTPK